MTVGRMRAVSSKLLEQWVSQARKGSVRGIRPDINAGNQGGLRF